MSDNAFWIAFWCLLFGYWLMGSFTNYKIAKIESDTKITIEKMRIESDERLRDSLKRMVDTVAEVKKKHE